jgi:hypothetical protein
MRTWIVGAVAAAAAASGCDATLETRCITGADCSDYAPEPATGEGGAGGEGGGGMGGAGPACYEGCDTMAVSGNTGEYPCAVVPIVAICLNCHGGSGPGPFALNTYEDSQQLYFGTTIWSRFNINITSDFMPQGGPPLTPDQKTAFLTDWACQCAPPRPVGETCD